MKVNKYTAERFDVDYKFGLDEDQVYQRRKEKLTNKTEVAVGKSISEIIFSNLFSFFNILLFVIAGFLIYAKAYSSLFFLTVLIPNILIGLIQDLYARHLMRKLRLMTAPMARVVRQGQKIEIKASDVVLDDVVILKSGDQICADGVVLNGSLAVNESLLTGESDNVYKNVGNEVFAGSYVGSGSAYVQMTSVGSDTYVSQLQNQANKFKRSPSEILKSLKRMFVVIGTLVIIFGLGLISVYLSQNKFGGDMINNSIKEIAGSMVSMIPSGLFLLTSVALATGVISLSKKRTAVQELYSIEMLARVDTLCVDKTGTITDGSMKVQQIVSLSSGYTNEQLKQIVSNVIIATNDENNTAVALREYFNYEQSSVATRVLPFSSENKYSGATLRGKGTFIIGALDFLNVANKKGVQLKVKDYTSRGYRVLVVAHSPEYINGNSFDSLLSPIALIILKDNVRPEAIETFKWFKENNVKIKVISGDDPVTVSEIAKEAGIEDADDYISLAGLSIEEVKELADKYTVFGRVTPEQKEALIISLKEKKHCVAMTGDGVNDILALKRADCSIAMAAGSSAARNVSHIVLLDSDFSRLPQVVAEGRRVINNIQRTSSLFLVKTTFAMSLTLFFIVMSLLNKDYSYPFLTNHMYTWEILAIGLPSFFLALQPNIELVKGNFLRNILKKAIPAGITSALIVITTFVIMLLDRNNIFYFSFESISQLIAICVPAFSVFSFIFLYNICGPINFKTNKFRSVVFLVFAFLGIGVLIFDYVSCLYLPFDNVLSIPWNTLNPENYIILLVVTTLISSIYIIANNLIKTLKGDSTNAVDK